MNRNVVITLGIVGAAVLAWWLLSGPSEDEKRIRDTVQKMAHAVEAGDADALALHIAADYSDRFGHDAEGAAQRAIREVQHYDSLVVDLQQVDVDIEEETGFATVSMRPQFQGEIVGERATKRAHYKFDKGQKLVLRMRKHGNDWLVIRAGIAWSLTDMVGDRL